MLETSCMKQKKGKGLRDNRVVNCQDQTGGEVSSHVRSGNEEVLRGRQAIKDFCIVLFTIGDRKIRCGNAVKKKEAEKWALVVNRESNLRISGIMN